MAVSESRPAVPAVLYDVDEAAEALRLSRSVLYELIRSGRLRTVKQGRRRLVPVSALAEYVDSWAVGRDSGPRRKDRREAGCRQAGRAHRAEPQGASK